MDAVVALPQWQEVLEKNRRNRDRFLSMEREEFLRVMDRWMLAYCACDEGLVPGLTDADVERLQAPALVFRSGVSDMYETMAVWETDTTLATQSDLTAHYAKVWQAADKVVYSSSLAAPYTANTRLERHFDPRAVREVKAAARRDLLVGGPNLAAQALVAGLVDELQLIVWPVVLGGRKPALPTDVRADLELLDEHRFSNGVVQLRYRFV